jgi:hypothetical protein
MADQSEATARILDELHSIEAQLTALEKQSHKTHPQAKISTREAAALRKRQAKLLGELSKLR